MGVGGHLELWVHCVTCLAETGIERLNGCANVVSRESFITKHLFPCQVFASFLHPWELWWETV